MKHISRLFYFMRLSWEMQRAKKSKRIAWLYSISNHYLFKLKFTIMEIIGRVTADAKVNTLNGERKVVNFSVAVNDSYKAKGTEQPVKVTNFFNCSYWMRPAIAQHLTKGTLVELYGRISVNAWTNSEGQPKASLNFHVNQIKLHGKGKAVTTDAIPEAEAITEPDDDLPF